MKIAVLGLGSIGLRHAKNALGLGVDVVGFDPSPDLRQEVLRSRKEISDGYGQRRVERMV